MIAVSVRSQSQEPAAASPSDFDEFLLAYTRCSLSEEDVNLNMVAGHVQCCPECLEWLALQQMLRGILN